VTGKNVKRHQNEKRGKGGITLFYSSLFLCPTGAQETPRSEIRETLEARATEGGPGAREPVDPHAADDAYSRRWTISVVSAQDFFDIGTLALRVCH